MDIVALATTSVNMSDDMEIAVGSRRFDLRSVVNTVDFAFKSDPISFHACEGPTLGDRWLFSGNNRSRHCRRLYLIRFQ